MTAGHDRPKVIWGGEPAWGRDSLYERFLAGGVWALDTSGPGCD